MNVGAEGTAGPTINIKNCNEGLAAADLNVYSGNITIHAEDDCMNAANSDLTGYAFSLNIAGGNLTMDTSSGDGIDSNGTLTVSSGTTVVWTASTSDNQPLDADGLISITGGTVFAAGGSAGMGYHLDAVPLDVPSEGMFQDVAASSWYADAVRYVTANGLMSGTDGSHFSPDSTTTRAMVMTVLARRAGVDTVGGSTWYEKAMSWSVQQGISDGSAPASNATRAETAALLMHFCENTAPKRRVSDLMPRR